MEQQEALLIGELASLAGVTPRTIRYYTSERLLPPPTTRGKYAHYNGEHLRLLRLIARLKEDYLPLSAIRGRLATMGAAEAERLLAAPPEEEGRPGQRVWAQADAQPSAPQRAAGMLAERPASYELPGAAQRPERPAQALAESQAAELSNPFRLIPASLPLGRVEFFPPATEGADAADQEPPRGAASGEELWRHFAVAPGIELRVREPLSPRRRRQVEALLAAIRDKLQGEVEE